MKPLRALAWFFTRHDAAPQAFCAPDAGAQAFELNDLAMIDKEVHIRAIVFDATRLESAVRACPGCLWGACAPPELASALHCR